MTGDPIENGVGHPGGDGRTADHRYGPMEFNGRRVYGYAVPTADGLRLRLAVDDWERSGVPVGDRVTVRFGRRQFAFFVCSATFVDPGWQWIILMDVPGQRRAAGDAVGSGERASSA